MMAKGFKAPKMNNPMGMMGQIQKLQEQIQQVQEQLAVETVTASAGGGAVKITVTGNQVCKAVEIDPELLKDADVEMLQDLILTAFNNALEASRDMAAERLGPLAGGLPF
jgi:DNA-binding YbaB/EbfC family protein